MQFFSQTTTVNLTKQLQVSAAVSSHHQADLKNIKKIQPTHVAVFVQ
jgi:hypothetical protein